MTIKEKTIALIDALKATCQSYGMGNDGNEYKIITQVFLYKFINDKFGYEVKQISSKLAAAENGKMCIAGCLKKNGWSYLTSLSMCLIFGRNTLFLPFGISSQREISI